MTDASTPTPPPSALAIASAATGLASDPDLFRSAVRSASDATGLADGLIVHDYWLVRSLYGVSTVLPHDGAVVVGEPNKKHSDRRVGVWAFGGGTSLTAAWGVVERYSEDIDGNLFADEPLSRSAFARVHRRLSRAACDAVEASSHSTLGRTVRTTKIGVGGVPDFLRFETTLQGPDDNLVAPCTVSSLIGQHADAELARERPELGGFEMPCVRPEWTAVNKLDALHRRAVVGDLDGLTERGRDLYDLWAMARSEHADTIRERTPELWERAASGIRTPVPRPVGGYATSAAFRIGSEESEALRTGYDNAVEATVWGEAPSFEDAISAVASLDG